MRVESRHMIEEQGLGERVCLLGTRSPEALSAYYAEADLFVLPSYYEGYGMVVTEALAHGLPVITTTGRAHCATPCPKERGMAVEPGDAQAFAYALASVARRGRAAGSVTPKGPWKRGRQQQDWSSAAAKAFAAALGEG